MPRQETDTMELNEFISEWKDDPIGLAHFCGQAMGASVYIYSFFDGFGSAITSKARACERIDFLYASDLKPVRDPQIFNQCVEVGQRSGVPWITDKVGDHRFLGVMFLRGTEDGEVYSIRRFFGEDSFGHVVGERVEHSYVSPFTGSDEKVVYEHAGSSDHRFWNFRTSVVGVEIEPRSEGFRDLMETKIIMSLLVWTTNMLGFE